MERIGRCTATTVNHRLSGTIGRDDTASVSAARFGLCADCDTDCNAHTHGNCHSNCHGHPDTHVLAHCNWHGHQDIHAHATPTATGTSTRTATPTRTQTPGVPPVLQGRVVHTHSANATSWAGQTDYWNYVNQNVVNDMVDQGMMALTGTATVADAWRTLLPGYQPGQGIAIKVSFNNTDTCNNTDGAIDGIIEPVNAIVSGLQRIGVRTADIWVYDATRALPDRFVSGGLAGIRYFDGSWQGICRNPAGFDGRSESRIVFSPPSGVPMPPDEYITDVLVNAHYLINMPIMKRHGCGRVFGLQESFWDDRQSRRATSIY